MHAYIEITNICNRQCPFCPGTERQKIFVAPDVFEARLKKLTGIEELHLHVLGEPLLHPDFPKIIRACRHVGIPVNLTTNGTRLTDEISWLILQEGIFRQVNFSLQALTRDDLSVLDHILTFCSQAAQVRPDLYVNLRLWNLDHQYVQPETNSLFLQKIYRKLGLFMPKDLTFKPDWRSLPLTGRIYLHGSSLFEWPVNAAGNNDSAPAFCHGLTSQIGILADGSVVPCCLDSEGSITLGNLDRQSLEEILQSPRAEAIRQGFKDGKAVESLCQRCTYRTTHIRHREEK